MGTLNPETLRKMVESANRKLNELEKVQKSRKIGRYVYDENKKKLVYRKFDFGDVRYADSSQAYGHLRSKAKLIPYIVYDEKTKKLRFKATLNDIKKMSDSERRALYQHIRTFTKNKTSTKRNIDERFIRAYNTYKKHQKEFGLKSVISFQQYFEFISNSDFNRMFSMFGSDIVVDIMEGRLGVIENEHISTDITASLLTQVFNYFSKDIKITKKLPAQTVRNIIDTYMKKIKQIDSPLDINDTKDIEKLLGDSGVRLSALKARMRSTDDDDYRF